MTTSEWFAYRWSDAASRMASLPLWFWLALGLGLAAVILLNYVARFLAVIADQTVRIADAAEEIRGHVDTIRKEMDGTADQRRQRRMEAGIRDE
jgi:phosphate uptake regulator